MGRGLAVILSTNTNALNEVSLRGAGRRSNLKKIATLLSVARNDNVKTFSAFL